MQQQVQPNDLLGYVVEQNLLGFVITNLDGEILYVNHRMTEITGYAQTELLGQNPRILAGGKTPRRVYDEIWATILSGNIWHGEIHNRRKGGEPYRQITRIAPVFSTDGHITHLTATCEVEELVPQRLLTNHFSYTDPVTQLPTRDALLRRIGLAITQVQRTDSAFALLYIDIDRFKIINACCGPLLSDKLLLELSRRISAVIGHNDYLARVGGDEFAILLNDLDGERNILDLVTSVRAVVTQAFPLGDRAVSVTTSVGIATYPANADDAEGLIRAADAAMFQVSREGGDAFSFYSSDHHRQSVGRFDLSQALSNALDSEQIELYYQPKVSLISGEIFGVEALLRWQHPDRGQVSPSTFVPVAEESGLCARLGEWVLRRACMQLRKWQDGHLPRIRMAVNISPRYFIQTELADKIEQILYQTGVEPQYLEIELTESSMMFDAENSTSTIERIKRLGVSIALDDFGTGYSSLAYLSRFQVDTLKIDRTFVQDVVHNPVNASIVAATIAMGHKLCKTVLAEGVETEAQMRFLRRHDCDQMQGFLFSKAVPADQISRLLTSGRRLSFGDEALTEEQLLLLVDDEPNVLSALRRLFRREGYRVMTASNGAEALEILAMNQVQVIVSDQKMPTMTGSQLFQRVKEMYPETIRIVLSGYSEISTVTEAINQGAIWKYFSKPWDDQALLDEVRNAFRHASQNAQKQVFIQPPLKNRANPQESLN